MGLLLGVAKGQSYDGARLIPGSEKEVKLLSQNSTHYNPGHFWKFTVF